MISDINNKIFINYDSILKGKKNRMCPKVN